MRRSGTGLSRSDGCALESLRPWGSWFCGAGTRAQCHLVFEPMVEWASGLPSRQSCRHSSKNLATNGEMAGLRPGQRPTPPLTFLPCNQLAQPEDPRINEGFERVGGRTGDGIMAEILLRFIDAPGFDERPG